MLIHDIRKVLLFANGIPVDGNDQVATYHDWCVTQVRALIATAQTSLLSGPTGNRADDQNSIIGRQAHLLSQLWPDRQQRSYTQGGPPYRAQSDQVVEYSLGHIDGNGEADARALVGTAGGNQAVDADHFAVRVQQRPAGVPRIDRRIGLDGFFDGRTFRAADRAQRTDDAARHRSRKSKRVSDGKGFLADLKVLGIAEYGGNNAGRGNFDDRQVI